MNKKLLTLFLITAASLLLWTNFQKVAPQKPLVPSPSISTFPVHQIIKSGDTKVYEATVEALPNETAFDLLNRTQQTESKQYSFGKLVTKINGLENGKDNNYWTYFVNDQEASSSSDSYHLKPNDLILWKFSSQP